MDRHSQRQASASPSTKEIFLSHSSKQKGFARDLDFRLSSVGYTVFFDEKDDSLPRGQEFPSQIFSAANSCKLALVLLSEDFVTSAWPLMELCCFVDRLPPESSHASPQSFAILPLFYKLSPAELRAEQNVQKWRKEWERLELERKKDRIDAAKCEKAVTKVLRSHNGVARRPESDQGEPSYIDDIVQRISTILPRRNLALHRYGDGPHKKLVGLERLCQIIRQKFGELEDLQSEGNFSSLCIFGMFGVSGSGKSTICHHLCNFMFEEFKGKVIHLELPAKRMLDDDPCIKEQYVTLFSALRPDMKREFEKMDLRELYNLLLQKGGLYSHKMFLVFDDISPPNYASYERIMKAILSSDVLGSGSRVMVTAQSSAILERLLIDVKHRYKHRYTITEVPYLTKDEAMELIKHYCHPSVKEDVIPSLLDKCSFPSSSFMYVPFVFEQIGSVLKQNCPSDLEELDLVWKMVDKGKNEAINKLVDINFKHLSEELRALFFDIVLFIIPAGFSELHKATPILCRMHELSENNALELKWKIMDLREHCTLSVIGDKLRVHDIYVEYARSIPENSKSYVDTPSLDISSDALDMYMNAQNRRSSLSPIRLETQMKYSDARTIYIDCLRGLPHPHSDEGASYRDVALEIHLDVEVGSTTRALFVKNSRGYCKCTLSLSKKLSENLSSLVCLQMENVQLQSAPFMQTGSDYHVPNLVTVVIRNENLEDISMEMWRSLKNGWMSSFVDLVRHQIQSSTPSMRSVWLWNSKPSLPFVQRHAICNQLVSNNFGFAQQMKWLRTLILSNAGVRRLEIARTSFPVLEDLEVRNEAKEPIDVSIDNPPNLKNLVIVASSNLKNFLSYNDEPRSSNKTIGYSWSWQSRKLTLHLGECRWLQHVRVDDSFDRVKAGSLFPSSLTYLDLANDKCLQFKPTNWISSSMDQLYLLKELHLSCKVVKILDFTSQCSGRLPCLTKIHLRSCDSLTHVSVAPNCIPNLVQLNVSSCEKLQVIEGFHHMLLEQLKGLSLWQLPQLQIECDVRRRSSCEASTSTNASRLQLENISVNECPRVKINWEVLQAFEGMKSMAFEGQHIYRRQSDKENDDIAEGICRRQSDEEDDDEDISDEEDDDIDEGICRRQSDEEDDDLDEGKSDEEDDDIDEGICRRQSDEEDDDEDISDEEDAEQTQHALSRAAELLCRLTFLEGQFTFLKHLRLRRVAHLREIENIQHLYNLQDLHLSKLPDFARISGKWPTGLQVLRLVDCPMLLQIPPLEQTTELWWLSCSNCKRLRALEGRFGEMKGLEYVDLRGCESMEAFPMEELMEELKARRKGPYQSPPWDNVRVQRSKFATVEVIQRWLRDAEIGSRLWGTAVEALKANEGREKCYIFASSEDDMLYFVASTVRTLVKGRLR